MPVCGTYRKCLTSDNPRLNLALRLQFVYHIQELYLIYSAHDTEKRSIVMSVSVCQSQVFVCTRSDLRNYTSDLHHIFPHVRPTHGRGSVILIYMVSQKNKT